MARDFAKKFYQSTRWKRTRAAYMRSIVKVDGKLCPAGLCEKCFKRGFTQTADLVHHKEHITPENIDNPAITVSFDNLERLCRQCHAEEHPEVYESEYDKPRVAFDAEGNVIPL